MGYQGKAVVGWFQREELNGKGKGKKKKKEEEERRAEEDNVRIYS